MFGAVKLNPVPGFADVVLIGLIVVVVPNPNDGRVLAAVLVVAPNVTLAVGFDTNDPKPN